MRAQGGELVPSLLFAYPLGSNRLAVKKKQKQCDVTDRMNASSVVLLTINHGLNINFAIGIYTTVCMQHHCFQLTLDSTHTFLAIGSEK